MLNKQEQAFLRHLPKGREHAMTAKEIAGFMMVGYPVTTRQVRSIVSNLRRKGYLIASTTKSPAGFYTPETKEEAELCYRELRSRLKEMIITVLAYQKAAGLWSDTNGVD